MKVRKNGKILEKSLNITLLLIDCRSANKVCLTYLHAYLLSASWVEVQLKVEAGKQRDQHCSHLHEAQALRIVQCQIIYSHPNGGKKGKGNKSLHRPEATYVEESLPS